MTKKRKESLYRHIAAEFINKTMIAGTALLLIVAGINYFEMKWSWGNVLAKLGGDEFSSMLSVLAHNFPFKYLFVEQYFWIALVIAIAITIIGFGIKILIDRDSENIVIDICNSVWISAVIGFFAIITLKLWTAFNVYTYISTRDLILPAFSPGYFIWQTYGQLFLLGAVVFVIGSTIKIIYRHDSSRKAALISDTMFNGSLILLAYYLMIRILALDVVLHSGAGNIPKLFIISTQYSSFIIVVYIFLFTFFRALKRYNVETIAHRHMTRQLEELGELEEEQQVEEDEDIEKPERPAPPHPKKLLVQDEYLTEEEPKHPAYSIPDHPIHRYIQPKGKYKKKGK